MLIDQRDRTTSLLAQFKSNRLQAREGKALGPGKAGPSHFPLPGGHGLDSRHCQLFFFAVSLIYLYMQIQKFGPPKFMGPVRAAQSAQLQARAW